MGNGLLRQAQPRKQGLCPPRGRTYISISQHDFGNYLGLCIRPVYIYIGLNSWQHRVDAHLRYLIPQPYKRYGTMTLGITQARRVIKDDESAAYLADA